MSYVNLNPEQCNFSLRENPDQEPERPKIATVKSANAGETKSLEKGKKAGLYRRLCNGVISELRGVLGCSSNYSVNDTLSLALSTVKLDKLVSNFRMFELYDDNFDIRYLLKALSTAAMVFDKVGTVLYQSHNLTKHFVSVRSLVGQNISKIIYNDNEVLHNVFFLRKEEVVCQLRRGQTYYYRNSNHYVVLKGRLINTSSEPVFVAYFRGLPTMPMEPPNYFHKSRGVFDLSSLKFTPSRPSNINCLIGKRCVTMDISEDATQTSTEAIPFLVEAITSYGRFETTVNFNCLDGTVLLVRTESYSHPESANRVVVYMCPFAKVPLRVWERGIDVTSSNHLKLMNNR